MRRRAALAALVLSGCVSTSRTADLDDLRALTTHEPAAAELEGVVDDDVSLETAPAVRELLAAPVDPERAARIAILHHRELRASIRELGVSRGALAQAAVLPNPSVEFDLRYQEDRTQPLQADLSIELDLTASLLTPLRAETESHLLAAARYRVANDVLVRGYLARVRTIDAIAAQARLGVAMRALEAFAVGRDAARALEAAGNIPLLDRATQEAAYESARADAAMIELAALESREAFHRALGLGGDETSVELATTLPPVPEENVVPEDLEASVIRESLAIAEGRARLASHRARSGLENARGFLPDISVDAHGEQDGNTLEIGGGARVGLPVFDQRRGAAAAADAAFDAELERLQALAITLRSEARTLALRALSHHRRARAYRHTIAPARRAVYEQTLLQYNAMQVPVFRLLDAMRETFTTELAAIDEERLYWTSRLALDLLLAGGRVPLDTESAAGSTMDRAGASDAEH